MALSELLNPFEPQSPYLKREDNSVSLGDCDLGGVVSVLAQCPGQTRATQ